MRLKFYLYTVAISCIILSCKNNKRNQNLQKESKQKTQLTAKDILGNSEYLAISYGGYRKTTRDIQPTIAEVKEDTRNMVAKPLQAFPALETEETEMFNCLARSLRFILDMILKLRKLFM